MTVTTRSPADSMISMNPSRLGPSATRTNGVATATSGPARTATPPSRSPSRARQAGSSTTRFQRLGCESRW